MTAKSCMPAATQLKSAGQREAALIKYQQAVEVYPAYADGFYDLGVYYSEDSQVGCFASFTAQSILAKLQCIVMNISGHHIITRVHGHCIFSNRYRRTHH